jgi:hypothetical protein
MEEIVINLAKSVLKSLGKNGSNSLYNLKLEFNSDLYPLEMAVRLLEEKDFVKIINARNKDTGNDLLIELLPKYEYLDKNNLVNEEFALNPMENTLNFNDLKSLIADNEIKEVLKILQENISNDDYLNRLISLSQRYVSNERKLNMGTVGYDKANIEKSKIIKALLDLINEIEANLGLR